MALWNSLTKKVGHMLQPTSDDQDTNMNRTKCDGHGKKQAKMKKKSQQQPQHQEIDTSSTLSPEELQSREHGYSLDRLQQTFHGYIDADVVTLVAGNCDYVLSDTVDCLVNMMNTERAQRKLELHKLKNEFRDSYWRQSDIEDVYQQCNYDYRKTCEELADFIDEAMAKQETSEAQQKASVAKKKKPAAINDLHDLKDATVPGPSFSSSSSSSKCLPPPSNNIVLGRDNIEHLQKMFEKKNPTLAWSAMTTVLAKAKASGHLHVPLDDSTWSAIEQNLERHLNPKPRIKTTPVSSSTSGPSTSAAGPKKSNRNAQKKPPTPQASSSSRKTANQSKKWASTEAVVESFQEIVAEQQATAESAEEYAHLVERKLKSTTKDSTEAEEMRQEMFIESCKKFLLQNFPGFEPSILISLLEANAYDLHQTVMDIDPKSSLLETLDSQVASSSGLGSSSGSDSQSLKCDWSSDSIFDNVTSTSTPAAPNRQAVAGGSSGSTQAESNKVARGPRESPTLVEEFTMLETIAALVEQRMEVHMRKNMLKLRIKKLSQDFYHQELDQCHQELKEISEQIIDCFEANMHLSTFDLHGLIISEVATLVPNIIMTKLAGLKSSKRVAFKLITGRGSLNTTASIIGWVQHFLVKLGLDFDYDGPGAFAITLRKGDLSRTQQQLIHLRQE